MISIVNIPQLKDNYSYAILNNKEVIIIDPAEHVSILRYIEKNQLSLKSILITHHHGDHTAGVEGILNKFKVPVFSPSKKIKYSTKIIKNEDAEVTQIMKANNSSDTSILIDTLPKTESFSNGEIRVSTRVFDIACQAQNEPVLKTILSKYQLETLLPTGKFTP